MKFYKIVPKHVEEHKVSTRTRCDRCGNNVEQADTWNRDEVEIVARLGDVFPEGDFRKVHGVDACAKCFLVHVVPALAALGFKWRTWDSEEDEPREIEPRLDPGELTDEQGRKCR